MFLRTMGHHERAVNFPGKDQKRLRGEAILVWEAEQVRPN